MPNLTLLPTPRHLTLERGTYALESSKRIVLAGAPARDLLFSGQRLRDALLTHARVEWTLSASAAGPRDEIGATLRVDNTRVTNPEGYELDITAEGINIVAGSPRGIFCGVCTLIQVIQLSNYPTNKLSHYRTSALSNNRTTNLPCLHISDHPDFPARGVMLDISRDKVPTMETLYALVDLLASWKINQCQLYTEHTFAYRNHPDVWAQASPMTGQEILELDVFCRQRFVELVPNQNSFGHMRRWLVHDRYRDLAECPDGCDTAWGHFDEPFSLNPTDPRSLELMRSLYDELLPHFSSRLFNVGCDETVDLGRGRSKDICAERGAGRVYLDFLLQIHREAQARGRTMQFWGDVIIEHPELIPELPKDAIALEWGYEADHPFDDDGARFAAAGIPFYVCPGTSTWNSIAGRTDNALGNLLNAAENGLKHGAVGYLNTDWGDNGHWQCLPMSYLGFAYGAAVSWALDANRSLDVARAVSLHAFRDPAGAMGRVAYDLGNVYREIGMDLHNASGLFRILQMSLEQIREMGSASAQKLPPLALVADRHRRQPTGLTTAAVKRTLRAIDRSMRPLAKAKMQRPDARLIADEFESAAALLRHACQRALLALERDAARARQFKRELDADLRAIVKAYRRLWLARSRPGGLSGSVARFDRARKDYR